MSPTPAVATEPRPIRLLNLGMSWLPEQPGNGLDRVYHSLTDAFPSAGIDATGLVAGTSAVASSSGGRVRAFAADDAPLTQRMSGARRAVRRALEAPVDLVASHFALYTLPVLDLIGDRPFVVHFHGPWALESGAEGESGAKTWMKRTLEGRVYRRADRCIVLSEAFRAVLHQTYGVPIDRIDIVPGGADIDRFAVDASPDDARKRLGWPTDRPIILSVRRLAHRMGLDNLIDAVAALRERLPDVLLYVAGTGPLQGTLQAKIDALGLADHVTLLGFVPDGDLPLAYRAANVSIVPTVKLEGFGLITIESLAAGTPVLVTPIGGLPETVRGLSNDLILPDARTGTLTEHLQAALLHPERLPDAAACRDYARTSFSWQAVARNVRDVYERVL